MKKRIIPAFLSLLLLMSSSMSSAETVHYVNLENVIERVVDSDATIRGLRSSIPAIEEGLRRATEGAKRINELYDAYETYKIMYYDSEGTFDHLIDLSSGELTEELTDLSRKLAYVKDPDRIDVILDEIDFVTYSLMFGGEEPNLTQNQLYKKYAKSMEMIPISASNEYTKVLNNIDLIEGKLAVSATNLYMGVLDLKYAVQVQSENLNLRESIHKNLEALFEEGFISEFDLYVSQNEIMKTKHQINMLMLQQENLENALQRLMGYEVDETIVLDALLSRQPEMADISIAKSKLEAIANSPVIKAYAIDLEYFKKNLELYEKFDGFEFGAEYENLMYEIKRNELKLQQALWTLETNVENAFTDLIALENERLIKASEFRSASEKMRQGEKQYALGLIKETDIYALQLQLQAAKVAYGQADRALKNGHVKYSMLVKYGNEYSR